MTYSLHTETEFIKRRATGQSLEKISKDMKIARSTLARWDKEFSKIIEDSFYTLRESVISETVAQLELDFKSRVQKLSDELRKVETELSKRDLKNVSTAELIKLKIRLISLAESMIADTPTHVKAVYQKPCDSISWQETETADRGFYGNSYTYTDGI